MTFLASHTTPEMVYSILMAGPELGHRNNFQLAGYSRLNVFQRAKMTRHMLIFYFRTEEVATRTRVE